MLLKYFLRDFEMVPVAPIITDVTFVYYHYYYYYMATTCFGSLVAIIRYAVQKLEEGVEVEASTAYLMMATSGAKHVVAI
jgi:hypothetical protein